MEYFKKSRPQRFSFLSAAISLLFVSAAISTGCAKHYILVDATAVDIKGLTPPPEVSATRTYHEKKNDIGIFAIRLPEVCLTEGAGAVTGRTDSADTIMVTTCAVWLGELERSLANAGYRVISWDSVHRVATSRNLSTYEAAELQGVDAVIMVNSLEAHPVQSATFSQQQLSYYRSNPKGEARTPIELPEEARNKMREVISRHFVLHDSQGNSAVSATLDATVISVANNEAIWFYRHTLAEPLADTRDMAFLFRGRDRHYRPIRPLELSSEVKSDTVPGTQKQEQFRQREDMRTDPYREYTHRVTRQISQDFAQRFKSGSDG